MCLNIRPAFNGASIKTKALTLLIEHSPCCLLSVAAGFIGIPGMAHNPAIELALAIGGAIIGETVGHRLFHKKSAESRAEGYKKTLRRYGLSCLFGLASWGVHQTLLHKGSDNHNKHALIEHTFIKPRTACQNSV